MKRASVVDGIQGAPCDAIPCEWGAGEPTYVNKGASKNRKVGIILTACLILFSLFEVCVSFFGISCRDKLRNGPIGIGIYGTDMNNRFVCHEKVWSSEVLR